MAVGEHVGGYRHGVADAALGRVAARIDHRRQRPDADPWRSLGALSCGHPGPEYPTWTPDETRSFQRRPTASDLPARRATGRGGLRVRGLAGRRGPVVVADAAARPARPLRLALQGQVGVRGVAGAAGRAARAASRRREELDFRERNAAWIEDWIAPRRPRRARRPGALRPRVGGAAPLRARPRREADRRRADLRRARQRRPPRAPGALPGRRGRRARRPTRSPTRASCGATRSTTGRRCSGAATAGGSSGCGARSSSTTSPASTTSAASSPTGRCPRGARHALSGRWKRGPGPRGVRRRGRRARRPAADRRGPRRDHAGGRAPARRPRLPGHGDPPVRTSTRTRTARTTSPTTASTRSSTRARTTTTPLRGWYDVAARRPPRAGRRADRAPATRPALAADRARLLLARRASRWCRPRTCSGSARRRA